MKHLFQLLFLCLIGCNNMPQTTEISSEILDPMRVEVYENENREISFANKESAYYFTQSHENNHEEFSFFAGLNIAQNRIFQGYRLLDGTQDIPFSESTVEVYPYKMKRLYVNGMVETFWMHDYVNVLEVDVKNAQKKLGLKLLGDIKFIKKKDNMAFFSAMESSKVIGVLGKGNSLMKMNRKIISSSSKTGFFIAVGEDIEDAQQLLLETQQHHQQWKHNRINRMENLLLKNAFLTSTNTNFQNAMNWMVITMDQLVSEQQGYGIYAGLPWFNEYWGRDEFISMPGAVLVTGQFEWAKNILRSFGQFQETDKESEFYGRVPNIVNPSNIDYHTTDGTPRFVGELYDYVLYSGDQYLIEELYPTVQRSIEGALKNWTDEKGYLLHDDHETWMDARRNYDKLSYSPRGSRANDIQALWHKQLMAGVYFAQVMKDKKSEEKWQAVADKVKENFNKDFIDQKHNYIADRLDRNDKADYKIRPNQLFTYELADNKSLKWNATKICWEELVYPWGVSSLNRQDENFHPFHHSWENYHKDEGYHNGTIWLWLNGIAMQRMIEANQEEVAYKLFKNMNEQAMTMGVVGGLGENMDCYPRSNSPWPKLTGTYLQAWSNAEHLRVWYQHFLGIQPDMIKGKVLITPHIPVEVGDITYHSFIGEGYIEGQYSPLNQHYLYKFHNISSEITFSIKDFKDVTMEVEDGDVVALEINGDNLNYTHNSNFGDVSKDPQKVEDHQKTAQLFEGIQFCQPFTLEEHPVMKKSFKGDRGI
ncbi:amylo-alpha-1,6-glucosidase [Flammeovirga aprica]|uniref:Glycogen debranching enzyme C-terminal domain-containing protein n=1 Tax=Flammeovirga aprica JL-4 TaxID=694437 RepID=A0A7X9RZ21_9BACT|nr:amylo-alpha-1,6-glucosidase [Flammeovirga aprica]NME71314.1 hypothetical protein [Flammeovirga aprica JL-4]